MDSPRPNAFKFYEKKKNYTNRQALGASSPDSLFNTFDYTDEKLLNTKIALLLLLPRLLRRFLLSAPKLLSVGGVICFCPQEQSISSPHQHPISVTDFSINFYKHKKNTIAIFFI